MATTYKSEEGPLAHRHPVREMLDRLKQTVAEGQSARTPFLMAGTVLLFLLPIFIAVLTAAEVAAHLASG